MIRTVLIDDESNSLDILRAFITTYCPDLEIVGQAEDAQAAIALLEELKPSLVFLDVEMPLGSGFDILQKMEGTSFGVIFTTAHDQYALQAIKFSALDYLLKPISVSDLKAAVAKIVQQKQAEPSALPQLSAFYENVRQLNNQLRKVVLPTVDGFRVVELKNIVRCQADDNYTFFILASREKVLVSRTLKEDEALFADADFIRVHHSHLINAAHVQRYIKGSGGYVQLSDDSIIEVSRRKKDELMKRFVG